MFLANSLLASAILSKLPIIVGVACGVILLIAFFIGIGRGYCRVGKGNLYWAISGVGFIFVYKFLSDKNPLEAMLKGKWLKVSQFAWTMVLLLGCILIALLLYGIFSAVFSPKEAVARKKKEGEEYKLYDDILVVTDEVETQTDYRGNIYPRVKKTYKPSPMGRICGGLMCVINTALMLVMLVSLALLIVYNTSVFNKAVGDVLQKGYIQKTLKYVTRYAMDFLTIGIIFGFAYKGFRAGFIGSIRSVVKSLGIVAAIGFCFAIPFIKPIASLKLFELFIDRCISLFGKMDPKYGRILGKVLAGGCMAVAAVLIIGILVFFLRLLSNAIEGTTVLSIIDGALAAILYLVLGVAVCLLLWGGLYLLDYCGLYYAHELFNEKSVLSNQFFEVAEKCLQKFADKFLLKFKA